jgi:predicted GH43/DUF377 family glycosyl hydrolase
VIVAVCISDNREAQIGGAVQSVVDHVDRVLLVDTGITDETIERASEIAGDKLVVVEHSWVDFSTARNKGLDAAEALGAKWVLLVDSDERLNFGALDLRKHLTETEADVLSVESDDGSYLKQRVIRAGSKARFYGPTHEALIGGGLRETLSGATFSELEKSDAQLRRKAERDVTLLISFIAQHPSDPRWYYYLGASFESLGLQKMAADMYRRCADLRGSGHEAAWAKFKEADQLHRIGWHEAAIAAAAAGLGIDPTLAECACVAGEAALSAGRPEQAIVWARAAEAVGLFRGCGTTRKWFRHPPSLYERPYDILLRALPEGPGPDRVEATNDFREARLARVGVDRRDVDRLSVSRGVSQSVREELRQMLLPRPLGEVYQSARHAQILFTPGNGWHPTNPSVCRHNDEIWCVVRTVNYELDQGHYEIDDPNGVIRTENYIGRLSAEYELIEPHLMRDLDPSERYTSRVVGYEDVRIVSLGESLAASATVCDRDPDGRCLIAQLRLDDGDVRRAVVQPSNQPHEKNWMPLAVDGALTWIYSLDPTAILPGPLHACPFALDHLRGGAAIAIDGKYLCVMHEVAKTDEGRAYAHRFVLLDSEFRVIRISEAWVFAHYGVEFCAGIVQDGDDLILSYGVEDREAWVARVSMAEVLVSLKWKPPKRSRAVKRSKKIQVAVVNSSHDRCGVHEYGEQLNRAFEGAVDVIPRTHSDVTAAALSSADVVLVHFENGLVSERLLETLESAKGHGAKVVFCCHNYSLDIVTPFLPLVDRFVLHREYDDAPSNSIQIPLGCPAYEPEETREQIRERLGFTGKIVVTSIGFLAAWKRWGDVIDAVAENLPSDAFLHIHTAIPYSSDPARIARDIARIGAALAQGRGEHSTEFLPETVLLDQIYASDMGFVFNPMHTGSVSAATKQFVSARCPLIVTDSTHASDLEEGIARVASFDPHVFAHEVHKVVEDATLRARMAAGMCREYARLNMAATAEKYVRLFEDLIK